MSNYGDEPYGMWLPCMHQLKPRCPYCRIQELEKEIDTAKSAYADLLVNSARELRAAEAKLRAVEGLPWQYADTQFRKDCKMIFLDALEAALKEGEQP